MHNEHSDYSSTEDHENHSDDTINFLLKYTDSIIDMFYDLESRFSVCNAHFLCWLKSTDITDFLVSSLFLQNTETLYQQFYDKHWFIYDLFVEEFQQELSTSFDVISSLNKKTKKRLSFDEWSKFCMQYCILDDLHYSRRLLY